MSDYLMIENGIGVVPSVEMMSTLGLSGSRGNNNKIGMFGSGFPYSLALLARHNLLDGVKICLSTDVYTFNVEEKYVNDSTGREHLSRTIVMKKQNGGTYPLNISTEFGALDWPDVTMAVREFISNALDGAESFDGSYKTVKVEKVTGESRKLRAKDGLIRIYIPMSFDIEGYINELYKYFPCLMPGFSGQRQVGPNTKNTDVRIYRKGVLVGEYGEKSLFHYNINDIPIDESRVVDRSEAREHCAVAIATCSNPDVIEKFIRCRMDDNNEMFENTFSSYYFNPYNLRNIKDEYISAWKEAFRRVVGNSVVVNSDFIEKIVRSKGYHTITLPDSLAALAAKCGCKLAHDVLNASELEGKEILPATPEVVMLVDRVWRVLERYNLTLGKPKPDAQCFVQHVQEGGMSGYYRPGGNTIYVRTDIADNTGVYTLQVVIEEICHYVTCASDMTREFQTFAFNLAALLMKDSEVYNQW